MSFSNEIFGNYTKMNNKRIKDIVNKTNEYSKKCENITHSQKRRSYTSKETGITTYYTEEELEFLKITCYLRKQLREGKTIDDIMPLAFAIAREASRRKIGIYQYDVQIEAASAMQDNVIAEMKTGEGKTFVQTLSAYLNALEATKSLDKREWKSVHVLTANDYLAKRDKEENERVYSLLGLTTGYGIPQSQIKSGEHTKEEKRKEYDSDIVYATAKTVAFDYLDDNHAYKKEDIFLRRPLHRAIVDEADDILLDQATKPLILSKGTSDNSNFELYEWATKFINGEKGYNNKKLNCRKVAQKISGVELKFEKDDENNNKTYYDAIFYRNTQEIDLSEDLYDEIYSSSPYLRKIKEKYSDQEIEYAIKKCLLAREGIINGKQYQVIEDKKDVLSVALIDSSTGRIMPNTTYSDGLQEAIEAKEKYLLDKAQVGMVGNKKTLKYSFKNETIAKCTYPDFVKIYSDGICGMTGTSDIEEFKDIYGLETYIVPSRLPNIRKDEEDELYVSESAKLKAILKEVLKCQKTLQPVLIGTTCVKESDKICNILNRFGIRYQRLDAVNRENEDDVKRNAGLLGMVTVATNMAGRGIDIKLGEGVKEVGGLYVISSSKNKNKRIDNQLKGRAARQGQPGKTKCFMSLDDEIVRNNYSGKTFYFFKKLYAGFEGIIKNSKLLKIIDRCQLREESHRKLERRQSEEREDKVFTKHKNIIYKERRKILEADDEKLHDIIVVSFKTYIDDLFSKYDQLEIEAKLGHLVDLNKCYSKNIDEYKNNIINSLNNSFNSIRCDKNYYENIRTNMLKIIDDYWISHMHKLDYISESCSYYSNPIEMYQKEALSDLMIAFSYIKNEIITYSLNPNYKYGDYVVKEKESFEEKNDLAKVTINQNDLIMSM